MATDNDLNTWIRRAAGRLPAETEATDTDKKQPPTDETPKPTSADERMNDWIRRQLGR